ncbi:MAG TPA: M20/M25/M40 family metallo-hydrolase [Planctomycetaceae bacterium]|nr:M20/M25/M40 family metallo-hydrolase [Planctomycetaceae bacterium]
MKNRLADRRIRSRSIAILLLLGGCLGAGSAPLFGGSYPSAVATIDRQQLRRHCEFLASDALEGRETGTRGGQAAGAYIVAQLRKLKVPPAGADGDYYQPFQSASRNILCKLPGSDPTLAKEYLIVGAHYDHVGYGSARNSHGPFGYIHRGADDNASGTATLLELIGAFNSLDAAPKRTLLFVFWDAEEQGLLGSEYWCQYPTVPLEGLKLVFNIDMVGRLRENRAEVLGGRTAPGLRGLIAANNADPPVSLSFSWDSRRDSDHYPFFSRQIPYLMVFTGKHPEYHTPYDNVDKLNTEGIERVARLLFRTVYAAAQTPRLPAFRQAAFQENSALRDAVEVASELPQPRLGVTWDEQLARRQVIEIAQVDPASPAEAAGIRGGDRILKFAGAAVQSAAEIREAVCGAPEETTAVIVHHGESSPRTLHVHLSGSPHPVGVFCRSDDAEPGSLIVSRVLPGSSAERAGLRLNDRIRKVGDRAVISPEQLSARLLGPVGSQSLEIERDGEIRTLVLTRPK